MVRQRSPSPHGMRFIIGIQPGCLPFPTGDSLFENASDRAAFVAVVRGSSPVLDLERMLRLFLPYNSYIKNNPSIDHTVVATARVGH